MTPAWKQLWPNVDKLLRMPEFKCIVVKERKAIAEHVAREELEQWTTKLEVGILGLLWCEGSMRAKANFFYDLANPTENAASGHINGLTWSDDELKFIFVKLLYAAVDLPKKYASQFKLLGGQQLNVIYDEESNLSVDEMIKCVEHELAQSDKKYGDERYFDDWFIEPFFGDQSLLSREICIERLVHGSLTDDIDEHGVPRKATFNWLFDADQLKQQVLDA